MFEFREVHTEQERDIFADLKVALMKYHMEFADKLGISDDELINYTKVQALSTFQQRINVLFYSGDMPVGMAQMEEQISDIDNMPILFINSMYIIPEVHNKGIGGIFLKYIGRKYKKRIECECWYELPVGELYQRAGFRPIKTRYMLPLGNRYYGSDQNCMSE